MTSVPIITSRSQTAAEVLTILHLLFSPQGGGSREEMGMASRLFARRWHGLHLLTCYWLKPIKT
jgi:hypothetical protein